jgi:hypothetical protein
MTNKHQKRRQQWMAQLEDEIVRLDPSRAGRIDWDTASFMFSQSANDQRLTPAAAAARMVGKPAAGVFEWLAGDNKPDQLGYTVIDPDRWQAVVALTRGGR